MAARKSKSKPEPKPVASDANGLFHRPFVTLDIHIKSVRGWATEAKISEALGLEILESIKIHLLPLVERWQITHDRIPSIILATLRACETAYAERKTEWNQIPPHIFHGIGFLTTCNTFAMAQRSGALSQTEEIEFFAGAMWIYGVAAGHFANESGAMSAARFDAALYEENEGHKRSKAKGSDKGGKIVSERSLAWRRSANDVASGYVGAFRGVGRLTAGGLADHILTTWSAGTQYEHLKIRRVKKDSGAIRFAFPSRQSIAKEVGKHVPIL
jgi:hypothetical protein